MDKARLLQLLVMLVPLAVIASCTVVHVLAVIEIGDHAKAAMSWFGVAVCFGYGLLDSSLPLRSGWRVLPVAGALTSLWMV